jgi:hypothetical protein
LRWRANFINNENAALAVARHTFDVEETATYAADQDVANKKHDVL